MNSGIARFVAQRLLSSALLLILLSALVFFAVRLAPGGPFDTDRVFPPEIQAAIQKQYHLDQPVSAQFARWLVDAARGDFHESFQYLGKPVAAIIAEGVPASLGLGLGALFLSLLVGVPLGALSARRPGSWLDTSTTFIAIAGLSLPIYLLASLLILLFSLHLGWLPPALWEGPSSWVLPIVTLAARPVALVARMIRVSVITELQSDYVRTARGKGLPESAVLFRHAVRNSLLPLLSVLGPLAANLVTGSFLVEVVYQIPGIGKYFVNAVINRDYPLVMGVTVFYGVTLVLANLAVDLLYGWADPRIRIAAPGGGRA